MSEKDQMQIEAINALQHGFLCCSNLGGSLQAALRAMCMDFNAQL